MNTLIDRRKMSAQEVLDKYWDKKLPVDVLSIAKKIGLDTYSLSQEEMAEGISGRFEIKNGYPILFVNTNEPATRQRFTLAHELAHFCLNHGDSFRDTRESMYSYDPKEYEANIFAADLLMPEGYVRHLIVNDGFTDISDMAEIFNVSYSAMRIRLERLGFL